MISRVEDDRDMSADALSLSVPAERRALGGVRLSVRSFVDDHGADPEMGDEFELVVSELATNVVEHTNADSITVELACHGDRWELTVSDCDDLVFCDARTLPPAQVATGRGLFIVQSLMDSIETVEVGGHRAIRCTKSV